MLEAALAAMLSEISGHDWFWREWSQSRLKHRLTFYLDDFFSAKATNKYTKHLPVIAWQSWDSNFLGWVQLHHKSCTNRLKPPLWIRMSRNGRMERSFFDQTGKRGSPQKVFFRNFPGWTETNPLTFWTEISGICGWMDRARWFLDGLYIFSSSVSKWEIFTDLFDRGIKISGWKL